VSVQQSSEELNQLQTFLVRLGAAMNAVGQPVYAIQDGLKRVAVAYGSAGARITAFPTTLLVTVGSGSPVVLDVTTPLSSIPRLDQIEAIDKLLAEAERAAVVPSDGLRRLREIRDLPPRFGPIMSILGYVVLTIGICMILHPALRDIGVAGAFGAIVGTLRLVTRNQPTLQILLPVLAALCVSALTALAVKHDWADPGLRAMISSLVVFIPGAALTTSVLELAAGDMIAGSSRLVWASLQLVLLAFGIVAGIEAAGVPSSQAFSSHEHLMGAWAPWLGVLIFAIGVVVAHSVPPKAFWGLVVVLYAAWTGQVFGSHVFGGYASGLVGALVMTPVASYVARFPWAMSVYSSFLPGFWLLVPGAISLIGLTAVAGNASVTGSKDFFAAVASIVSVALGVLLGTQVQHWLEAGERRLKPLERRSRGWLSTPRSGDDL
jgi:uncharacterized membrane protein YjjP (DUF1212 family)